MEPKAACVRCHRRITTNEAIKDPASKRWYCRDYLACGAAENELYRRYQARRR